ncbi:SPOR domain-containing protein [Litoribaculum gwangyangense]|uniref:SPOR domain-containing protein n=1 Tax=Litoribaculum gwangyangense TaxID=1130722 RepID=A0ABP9BZE9_9FLAO
MQLETYISDLLYRYECVTIPDFGAFLTQNSPATIDDASNTFFAPKKMVSFNEQIQKNDGLLANYIADVEKIPFETANKKIAKRVKILKSYLTQGETLTFKNIGDIVFNNEGKILFEPSYHLNYLTDSFGLSQFVSPQVNREAYKKEVETIEKVIPITVTPEKRKPRLYLRYAAVALIALTIGGSVASNYYVNQIEKHNQLAQLEAAKQLETKIQEATFNLNPLPAVTLNVTKQTGNYHIVAGAFRIKENSEKKVNQLRELGYNARIIGLNKFGLYEVIYSSHETGTDALKAIREIRKTHNKDAWIKIESKTSQILSPSKTKFETESSNENSIDASEKETTNLSSETINTNIKSPPENANIIQIVRGVSNLENGYYIILNTYSEPSERDAFMEKLHSEGITNAGFFFHGNSARYFVYTEKFNTLEAVQKKLKTQPNFSLNSKPRIVKVEN